MKTIIIALFGLLIICLLWASPDKNNDSQSTSPHPIIKTTVGKDSVYVVTGNVVKVLWDDNLKVNRIYIERK